MPMPRWAVALGVPVAVVASAVICLPSSWASVRGPNRSPTSPITAKPPATVIVDGARLVAVRHALAQRGSGGALRTDLARLTKSANADLAASAGTDLEGGIAGGGGEGRLG